MTPCSCPLAGWCERHNMTKTEHYHMLCQTRDDYRTAWDELHGPGQNNNQNIIMRKSLSCINRSTSIGTLSSCSSSYIYNCNKYNTTCTMNATNKYASIICNKKVIGQLTKTNRSCSICKANNEDT